MFHSLFAHRPYRKLAGASCALRYLLFARPLAVVLAIAATLIAAPHYSAAQTQADPEKAANALPGSVAESVESTASAAGSAAPQVMAATANTHATAAALEMLRAGGNALDAAAAAQFALNVVEPQSSGIGGGGFLMIYLAAEKTVVAVDGREEAPAMADPSMFLGPDGKPIPFFPDRITGGNAVGVPGLLAALDKSLKLHGSMTLAQVMAPAIRLADQGFRVSPRLAESLQRHAKRLALFSATRQVFFTPLGQTLPSGYWLRQPWLASTFRLLSAQGVAPFYGGEIGRDIVRTVRESEVNPGRMTIEDLRAYEAPLRKPVRGSYRGYTVYGMPPPTSGGITLIQMLQLLETQALSKFAPRSVEVLHRFAIATGLAYADRGRYLADPDFVSVPVAGLLSKAYARERAGSVDWSAPLSEAVPGMPQGAENLVWGEWESAESPSTTHLSIVDGERNMVALTSSVEQAFGSGMVVPGRGFFLNNQLTDFSARPSDELGRPIANRAQGGKRPRRNALDQPAHAGGKRPRSSMSPTLVLRGDRPLMAIGSPGGARIIQYVAWVLVQTLDYAVPLQAAVEAPHVTHFRGQTAIEEGLDSGGVGAALTKLGHKVRVRDLNSGLHGVWIDPRSGLLHGAADPRREGTAMGY